MSQLALCVLQTRNVPSTAWLQLIVPQILLPLALVSTDAIRIFLTAKTKCSQPLLSHQEWMWRFKLEESVLEEWTKPVEIPGIALQGTCALLPSLRIGLNVLLATTPRMEFGYVCRAPKEATVH